MKRDYIFVNGCDGGVLPTLSALSLAEQLFLGSSLTEDEARERVLELAEQNHGFLVSAFRLTEFFTAQDAGDDFVDHNGTEIRGVRKPFCAEVCDASDES